MLASRTYCRRLHVVSKLVVGNTRASATSKLAVPHNLRHGRFKHEAPLPPAAVEHGGQEAALAHALQLVAVAAHLRLWHKEQCQDV